MILLTNRMSGNYNSAKLDFEPVICSLPHCAGREMWSESRVSFYTFFRLHGSGPSFPASSEGNQALVKGFLYSLTLEPI